MCLQTSAIFAEITGTLERLTIYPGAAPGCVQEVAKTQEIWLLQNGKGEKMSPG